ncbi:hypothetical protein V6N12_021448 [Hibiscus sabdariffa]|uniref:Uncharacterized protein n=1 Tax=Hibiscus sabdariffa TaxID=183260 RepID=A0ABR2FRQ9_9ROSI
MCQIPTIRQRRKKAPFMIGFKIIVVDSEPFELSRVRLDPESDGSSEGIVPIILLEYSVTNENSCSRNKEISCPEFCCVISITLKQF